MVVGYLYLFVYTFPLSLPVTLIILKYSIKRMSTQQIFSEICAYIRISYFYQCTDILEVQKNKC